MKQNPKPKPSTLGAFLRHARTEGGLSFRQVEMMTGIPRNTICRLENDEVERPAPENLALLASALEVKTSDLFLLAGMPLPEGLPSLPVMLRAEYDLPDAGIREAEASIRAIVAKYEARSASTGSNT
ncbi:HTH cro/C1-type domain-containing protein [Frankia sp. Hr75.2]|nr:HTH cro/C1-type domain-containing protein [Frankia sp. Hr75.2]